jgi:hypothetical protein
MKELEHLNVEQLRTIARIHKIMPGRGIVFANKKILVELLDGVYTEEDLTIVGDKRQRQPRFAPKHSTKKETYPSIPDFTMFIISTIKRFAKSADDQRDLAQTLGDAESVAFHKGGMVAMEWIMEEIKNFKTAHVPFTKGERG